MWAQILVARRFQELNYLKIDLESLYGVKVTIAELDLSEHLACEAFYNALPDEQRDSIDILVNNAGFSAGLSTVVASDWELMSKMIDTNIKAVVKMIMLFVPGMLLRQSGHIINMGSVAGKDSVALAGMYCGTKHFVEAITTSLRAELVATPLRVSLVSPGWTESEFWTVASGGDKAAAAAASSGFQPLHVNDIADSVVYIASRPPHVQVVDLIVMPTAQSSIDKIHREFPKSEQN